MAKKIFKPRSHETGTIVTTKTAYGSTSEMLINIDDYVLPKELSLKENETICKDDKGYYITLKNRIDSGIADPNRYANEKNRVTLTEKVSST